MEPALRHAAMQRHLAAFEPALELVARTRLRALVSAAGLRALAGPVTAADALLRLLRAARTASDTRESMALLAAYPYDEVTHFVNHAARLRRVRQLHRVTDPAQTHAAERSSPASC